MRAAPWAPELKYTFPNIGLPGHSLKTKNMSGAIGAAALGCMRPAQMDKARVLAFHCLAGLVSEFRNLLDDSLSVWMRVRIHGL